MPRRTLGPRTGGGLALTLGAALLVHVGLAGVARAQTAAASDALRRDIDFARGKVYPALVNIQVVMRMHGDGRAQRFPGAGSGVIVSPGGHVLTNFHVAGNTTRVVCTLPTGEAIPAAVVAHDPLTDLSVLALQLALREDPTRPLPFATLGDSDALAVGDYVLAMGNPLGLSSSLTLGVVSNRARVFTDFTGTEIEDLELEEGERTGLFTRWLQHDALILPGNSGGPLVNLRGEVVGINELGGAGVGFAIPSNLAASVLNQVMTYGEVRRGWLGFSVMPVGKLGRRQGALVSYVVPGSPADLAGVRAGMVLRSLDGAATDVRYFEEVPPLYQRIAELQPGREVELAVEPAPTGERPPLGTAPRDDAGEPAEPARAAAQSIHLRARVARMEPFLGDEEELRSLGITVRGITGPMALARRFPSREGVLVTGLRPGYPVEKARPKLEAGDVITAIGGRPIADLGALREVVAALGSSADGPGPGPKEVIVAYRRGEASLITVFEPKAEERKPGGGELPKPWLGIETQVLTPAVARALGIPGKKGFRITRVFRGTRAAAAGLAPGDLLVALDGEPLEAHRVQDENDLRRAIEELSIGDDIGLDVLRPEPAGVMAARKLTVTLEETPSTAVEAKSARDDTLELAVREVTFLDRVRYQWEDAQGGVLVTEATSGGWAHMGGLRLNDLILRVNDREVRDLAAFEALLAELREAKPARLHVFLRRGYRTHFVFIEPDWAGAAGPR